MEGDEILKKLSDEHWIISNNPANSRAIEFRLIRPSKKHLDLEPYHESEDIIGFGTTIPEAARNAWQKKYGDI